MRITKLQHSRKQTPPHTRASRQVCTRIRNIDRVTRAILRQFHSFPACRLLPPLLLQPQLHPASIVAVLNAAKFCGSCLMQKFPRSSHRRYALALYRRSQNGISVPWSARYNPRHDNRFSRITLVSRRDSRGLSVY